MLSKESLEYFDWYVAGYHPSKEVEDSIKWVLEYLIDNTIEILKKERIKPIEAKLKTKDDWYEFITVILREFEKKIPDKFNLQIIGTDLESLFLHIIYTEIMKKRD